MILSGFYRPRWIDIYKAAVVICVLATCAQALNYVFDGSNADFMTLRYGNGNPFAFLLKDTPALYYIVLTAVSIGGMSLIITITILIQTLIAKQKHLVPKHAVTAH